MATVSNYQLAGDIAVAGGARRMAAKSRRPRHRHGGWRSAAIRGADNLSAERNGGERLAAENQERRGVMA